MGGGRVGMSTLATNLQNKVESHTIDNVLYQVEVIENYKWLNDTIYKSAGWLGKRKMKWLAVFIIKMQKLIFGEYKTFRRGKVIKDTLSN